jgi:hypothetical protein
MLAVIGVASSVCMSTYASGVAARWGSYHLVPGHWTTQFGRERAEADGLNTVVSAPHWQPTLQLDAGSPSRCVDADSALTGGWLDRQFDDRPPRPARTPAIAWPWALE